jgi:hypothetical protein
MAAIYGHRWVSSYGENPAGLGGDTWAAGLSDLPGVALARGIEACIAAADPWPPTLPEFRSMCLGIPSLADVRFELHEKTATRSMFAALVWQGIDGYAFRLASRESGDRMIRDAYELARVMRGGALPQEPAGAIEQEKREVVPAAPEVAAAALAECRSLLGGKMAAAGPDA